MFTVIMYTLYFQVIVLVVGANDIGQLQPKEIVDGIFSLCNELHTASPRYVNADICNT